MKLRSGDDAAHAGALLEPRGASRTSASRRRLRVALAAPARRFLRADWWAQRPAVRSRSERATDSGMQQGFGSPALTTPFHIESPVEHRWYSLAARRGFGHIHRLAFPRTNDLANDVEPLVGTVVASDCSRVLRRQEYIVELDDAAVVLLHRAGRLTVTVAAGSAASASARADLIEKALGEESPDEAAALVTFWSLARNGPINTSRLLTVPTWTEIEPNYPAAVRSRLDRLMEAGPNSDLRLVLWHGEPGTGKTTALRALADAWSNWCVLHYISDPEQFFGDGAHYLTHVLLDEERSPTGQLMHRLLVLEDAGELMSAEARLDAGQGLSRLLNLCDGMLGQGIDLSVLITTNEPLQKLHPAVTRPGRCSMEIEFDAFTAHEANSWLVDRGHDGAVRTPHALAELFAVLRGETTAERRPIGFANIN